MNLELRNYPVKDGFYMAANHNKVQNRLEVEKVQVVDSKVFVEGEEGYFIFQDFDYWTNEIQQ